MHAVKYFRQIKIDGFNVNCKFIEWKFNNIWETRVVINRLNLLDVNFWSSICCLSAVFGILLAFKLHVEF